MFLSVALLFLAGIFFAFVFSKFKIPGIIGMLCTGILLGPCFLNLIDFKLLNISTELRQFALIIILIKAGLSLNLNELKSVGRPALLLSFLPACFEISGYFILAPIFLGFSKSEALLLGAVISAVSPAVVVPRMVKLIEENKGSKNKIPQMILAGVSLDDVFVIVLFSSFLKINQGINVSFTEFLKIPLEIIFGILIGIIFGFLIYLLFEKSYSTKNKIRNTKKVIIIFAFSLLLMAFQEELKNILPFSALIAVMTLSANLKLKMEKQNSVMCAEKTSKKLSEKFGKLWILAEVVLFVLVGSAVEIKSLQFNFIGLIFACLLFRSVGVILCLCKTGLDIKEKLFCVVSYLPKATVQAAIGSVPFAAGLACGQEILAVAVTAIVLTAPLGAFGIDFLCKKNVLE